jgi:Holliday junction resolvase RusA-like endonuclease
MTKRRVAFIAWGRPRPKGSVSAFPIKREGGKTGAVVTHSKVSKSWEAVVGAAADDAVGEGWELLAEPVTFWAVFSMPRPKRPQFEIPATRSDDADKLVRAVWDALTDRVWDDDGRVAELYARVVYEGDTERGGLPRPGVRVMIETMLEDA